METAADDPFELFVSSTDIRYTYYHETHNILGQTFGMLVLQDFEALTPNTIARTVETVQGGGLVVLLLSSITSLRALHSLSMDSHAKFRSNAIPRFNRRFVTVLSKCNNCLVVDDLLSVLPMSNSSAGLEEEEHSRPQDVLRLERVSALAEKLEGTGAPHDLTKICYTQDQARAVLALLDSINSDSSATSSHVTAVTAARGRGKSAALGLAVAGSISFGYSLIVVTAPFADNLITFFEFCIKGLAAMGYVEHNDFIVEYLENDSKKKKKGKTVVAITVIKNQRQSIRYIHPSKVNQTGCDLIVIDEAAALPLPFVRSAIQPSLLSEKRDVFLASTVSGYEGTGRSLSLKLLSELRSKVDSGQNSFKLTELEITEPIRYSQNDPVERWLYDLLVLNATIQTPPAPETLPCLEECQLYLVNRDTLFSGHKSSEAFLKNVVSILVAAHYRNTPDELALLADSPAHRLFVLMPPLETVNMAQIPVLAVLHISLEGEIQREEVSKQLLSGERKAGDLIPWTISQNCLVEDFATLSGARVVRIAVNPAVMGMQYGSKSLELLSDWMEGKMLIDPENPNELPFVDGADGNPLVDSTSSALPPSFPPSVIYVHGDFTGWDLHSDLYTRLVPSDITGEFTGIVLKQITSRKALREETEFIEAQPGWLDDLSQDFSKRLSVLLGGELSGLDTTLALEALSPCLNPEESQEKSQFLTSFSVRDRLRISTYARSLVDRTVIADIVPFLALAWVRTHVPVALSAAQAAVLLASGLQRKSVTQISQELDIGTLRKLSEYLKNQEEERVSKDLNLDDVNVVNTLSDDVSSELSREGQTVVDDMNSINGISEADLKEVVSLPRMDEERKEKKERKRSSASSDQKKKRKKK
ncbi:hypothetical protein GEMRC1_011056 [Eukaryota sp. GEM-RC1]